MLKRHHAIFAAALIATGCATAPRITRPPPDYSSMPADPECVTQRQCDAVMAKAAEMLPKLTGMRLQLATATILETYRPTGFGRMGGRVQLVPLNQEKSAVRVTIDACYVSGDDCEHDSFERTKALRILLSNEAKLFALQGGKT